MMYLCMLGIWILTTIILHCMYVGVLSLYCCASLRLTASYLSCVSNHTRLVITSFFYQLCRLPLHQFFPYISRKCTSAPPSNFLFLLWNNAPSPHPLSGSPRSSLPVIIFILSTLPITTFTLTGCTFVQIHLIIL